MAVLIAFLFLSAIANIIFIFLVLRQREHIEEITSCPRYGIVRDYGNVIGLLRSRVKWIAEKGSEEVMQAKCGDSEKMRLAYKIHLDEEMKETEDAIDMLKRHSK